MIIDFAKTTAISVNSNLYANQAEAKSASVMQINLVKNNYTGLIFNNSFDPSKAVYNRHYNNDQSASAEFLNHMMSVKNILKKHFKKSIVEIGCGKGQFLEILQNDGFDVFGFDPSYEGHNPNITKEFFDFETNIKETDFILRHVLEHIPKPSDFLNRIKPKTGLVYIEVPCFEWIIENNAWYDITGEHVNYFTLESLQNLFDKIEESGFLFQGQYIYVIGDLANLKNVPNEHTTDLIFKGNVDFKSIFKDKKNIVVWGAAGKGITFCYQAFLNGFEPKMLIDINEKKWGLFVPGSGLEISKPSDIQKLVPEQTVILVANKVYLNEVKNLIGDKFEFCTL